MKKYSILVNLTQLLNFYNIIRQQTELYSKNDEFVLKMFYTNHGIFNKLNKYLL